ncbi:MAG: hypothetical protein ACYC9S_11100 [Leptospirales bacterium]
MVLPYVLPGTAVRIVDLEDLIRTKRYAGGPNDFWDVANLVLIYPETEKMALEDDCSDQDISG